MSWVQRCETEIHQEIIKICACRKKVSIKEMDAKFYAFLKENPNLSLAEKFTKFKQKESIGEFYDYQN